MDDHQEERTSPGKRTRPWSVKKIAPPGYYTAAEAQKKIGLSRSVFYVLVKQGKIKKHIPPLRKEGYYSQKEIDALATEMEVFLGTRLPDTAIELRVARAEDAQGIYEVIQSLGWKPSPISVRLSWLAVNPSLDHVVLVNSRVMAYISAVPFTPDVMEAMMRGTKHGGDITPDDLYSYQPGQTYDLFVGIAARKEMSRNPTYLIRLLSSFIRFLKGLKEQDIFIHYLYGSSAEEDGQTLATFLGFVPQDKPGEFPRFEIDLETSDGWLARMYRRE